MKIHQLGLLLMISSFSYAKNVDFKLEAVPLPKAISIIYDEVLQKPYMLDPKLSNDSRVI
ncbi:TPA: type II secretion system protein GspD, partial [Mannheimia haemolytica]|nr:type II secretion system protein GspD [Mannheimia haemolytica]